MAIRFGHWWIATRNEIDCVTACCGRCGIDLNPNNYVKAAELNYLYCSELCIKLELEDKKKEEDELNKLK